MRYYEKFEEHKVDSGFGFIIFILVNLVMAPFRLFSTISQKLLFLGDYVNTLFLISTCLNLVVLVVNFLFQFFYLGGLYLTSGTFPLVSLMVSLGLNGGMFYLTSMYKYPIDFDKISNIQKSIEVEIDEPEQELDLNLGTKIESVSDVLSDEEKQELVLNSNLKAVDEELEELDLEDSIMDLAYNSSEPDRFESDGDALVRPKRTKLGAGIMELANDMEEEINTHASQFHAGTNFVEESVELEFEDEDLFGNYLGR